MARAPATPGARPLRLDVVTIFPDYLRVLDLSLIGRAAGAGLIDLCVHDLRDWAHDRHRTVDDTPLGGGAGMVMRPDVWGEALDAVLDLDDGGADLHRDPLRHQQRRHGPGIGRGQFHQRLGGLDLDEHVVDVDLLPDGDPPGDDLGLGETLTGIREKELAFHHHSLSPRLTRPGNGRGRRGCGPPTAGTRLPGATAGRGCRSR